MYAVIRYAKVIDKKTANALRLASAVVNKSSQVSASDIYGHSPADTAVIVSLLGFTVVT